MEKIYENQNVLNYDNELVSDKSAKLDEIKEVKIIASLFFYYFIV